MILFSVTAAYVFILYFFNIFLRERKQLGEKEEKKIQV